MTSEILSLLRQQEFKTPAQYLQALNLFLKLAEAGAFETPQTLSETLEFFQTEVVEKRAENEHPQK